MSPSAREKLDKLTELIMEHEAKGQHSVANVYRTLANELVSKEFWASQQRQVAEGSLKKLESVE